MRNTVMPGGAYDKSCKGICTRIQKVKVYYFGSLFRSIVRVDGSLDVQGSGGDVNITILLDGWSCYLNSICYGH